jgi:hypothetical protein
MYGTHVARIVQLDGNGIEGYVIRDIEHSNSAIGVVA